MKIILRLLEIRKCISKKRTKYQMAKLDFDKLLHGYLKLQKPFFVKSLLMIIEGKRKNIFCVIQSMNIIQFHYFNTFKVYFNND